MITLPSRRTLVARGRNGKFLTTLAVIAAIVFLVGHVGSLFLLVTLALVMFIGWCLSA